MIDIKLIRENPEIVKKDLKKRGDLDTLKMVDELKKTDKKWRTSLKELEKLRHTRNKVSAEIAKMKGKEKESKINEMKKVGTQIKELEKKVDELKKKSQFYLDRIPNIMDPSVPVGKDDSENVELRKWGKIPKFDFKPKDHINIAADLDLADLERGAKVAGARFYYLKNDLVKLDLAIAMYALDFLVNEKKFTPMLVPVLIRNKALYAAGFLPLARADLYEIEGEDLNLIGTAEHPLCGLHMDEILKEKDLPFRYCGFSPCFRTEAGSHGRDTKGFFRVHQFNKIEQFTFCTPEQSKDEHELLIKNAETLFQRLEIPYRVVNICTGDLGWVAAKKYDIEAWLPGQGKYREVVSCSNCTDYQGRRANTRCWENPGAETRFVHTLNATAIAIERCIIAILENYQQKDGSVKIPKALQPYMGGQKVIAKKK
jgi:seryl-tRNA synthetase